MAGFLYPAEPELLQQRLTALAGGPAAATGQPAQAVIVPHSSLEFSGAVSGAVFGRIGSPRRCLLVGSNHSGYGSAWSLLDRGSFQTPLGEVSIDEGLAEVLQRACPRLEVDETAHLGEHAIEAVLPWLRWCGGEALSIVPIVVRSDVVDDAAEIGEAMAKAVRQLEAPVLLAASCDLTQHEPHEAVRGKDARLLEAVARLDLPLLEQVVETLRPSLCGLGALASVLEAARQLGAREAVCAAYATSADAGGDPGSSTGFAGVIIR